MMFRSAPRGMPAAASPRLPSSLSRHASAAACRALLLVLLVTAAPGTTRAGVARPTPMAAEGGVAAVTSLDALPDGTLLLTAGSHFEQGLFASDDAGESWQQRVASGVFPRRWYTEGYRYLTTTDGRLLAGPGVHPLTDEVVRFLFESRDGGRTWRDFDPGAEPIGVDPADPDLWLALSRYEDTTGYGCTAPERAVLRSEDAGRHWQSLACVPAEVAAVMPVSGASGILLGYSEETGLFRSHDGGATRRPVFSRGWWGRLFTGPSGTIFASYFDDGRGLVRLVQGGLSHAKVFGWDDGTQPDAWRLVRAVAADPRTAGRWVLGTEAGRLFESRDDGWTWQPLGEPPAPGPFPQNPGRPIGEIAITPQGRMVVAVEQGLERRLRISDDDGGTWHSPEEWPPATAALRAVLLSDPYSPALWGLGVTGLVRSVDHGASWQDLGSDDPEPSVLANNLIPTADALFTAVETADDLETYRFDRDAKEWNRVRSIQKRAIRASRMGCPLAALRVDEFCSMDLGRTWMRVENGRYVVRGTPTDRLFRFPLDEPFGLETQSGPGRPWRRELAGVQVDVLTGHPTDPDQAFAVGELDGERRAWHRDASGWRAGARLDDCRPEGDTVWGLDGEGALYNPVHPEWLYLVAAGCIQYSDDGGASWTRVADEAISGLLVADREDPRFLYLTGRRILLADADPLRLGDDDRFEVTVAWKGPRGATGAGVPQRLTDDTGYFWFFDRDNVELVVKVLDAAAVDQRYWVFYGALSNVEYEMTVVDTAVEGPSYPHVAEYLNPAGTMASRGDTEALPRPPDFPPWSAAAGRATAGSSSAALASEGSETLGLRDGRFEATVEWEDFRGNAGTGTARAITSDTGYFWFFSPDNVELVVKVLDGRPVNGRWWVFYGALSNVAYRLTVTDTETGETAVYDNPSGTFASVGDTAAFPRP